MRDVVVQSLICVQLFVTPWTAAHQVSLFLIISQSLLKLMSIESVMPSNYSILCHPLLLLSSHFPSIRVFFNESALIIRWPKYWSFSLSTSPSSEYSKLISFRIDRLDLLVVQRALKSLFQHHSSKAFTGSTGSLALRLLYSPTLISIHDYYKNYSFDYMDLCWQSDASGFEYAVWVGHSFSSKKHVSFNFVAAVTLCSDLRGQENKVYHCFHFPPSFGHEVMEPDAMIFIFWMLNFKPGFSFSFTFMKRLFSFSSFSALAEWPKCRISVN